VSTKTGAIQTTALPSGVKVNVLALAASGITHKKYIA
jgi:hypothetical protein